MPKIKLPQKIKVASQDYKVKQDYKFIENVNLLGQSDHYLGEIKLRTKDFSGADLTKDRQWCVFFHELIHTIDEHYNSHKLDEETVERLASGFAQVFKDNKIIRR